MTIASGDFSKAVQAFADKFPEKADIGLRKIGFELLSRVILGTPVKSGRARGNWQATTGSPASGIVEAEDKSGSATVASLRSCVGSWKPSTSGNSLFLTNNLPYIQRLEDGWSKQAPAGMVARAMADAQSVVEEAAR